jgi:hypothetical protein
MSVITIRISIGFVAASLRRPFFLRWYILDGGFLDTFRHDSMLYVTR